MLEKVPDFSFDERDTCPAPRPPSQVCRLIRLRFRFLLTVKAFDAAYTVVLSALVEIAADNEEKG